ncbi:MAG: hypothetical protein LBT47_13525 [Deltaproteobacteria bacterium]|jgi:hypothetical protein|nr:hypothetical protein [Deltaproteobacteria bacterium]
MTTLGKVTINRAALKPSRKIDERQLERLTNKKLLFPLDEAFGIDRLPFKISPSAMLEIAYWVQLIPSYKAARDAIIRNTPIRVNDDTMRNVANHIGSLVFEVDRNRAGTSWELLKTGRISFPQHKLDQVLYLEVDGAMLHTRKKKEHDVNDVQKKENEEHKSMWMENKLGLAFSSDNIRWWTGQDGERHHKIIKKEYISYLGDAEEFKKHMWALALRNGYGNYQQTILLSDGATWIRNMKEEIFPDAQQILDYYHLLENIFNFAKDVFKLDESKYKPWVTDIAKKFKESKTKEAIDQIRKLGNRILTKSKFNLLNYIQNNINNIDYGTYKKKGWFIGSGAIENGNKLVLQQRLKQAGMRWNEQTGQYILTLMSKSKSFLWEQDVVSLIHNKYDLVGAFLHMGYPLQPRPEFYELDQRLQQLKDNLAKGYNQRRKDNK